MEAVIYLSKRSKVRARNLLSVGSHAGKMHHYAQNLVGGETMKFKGMIGLLAVAWLLALAVGVSAAEEKGFLWDGNQWPQLSFDAKVGYVKGVGNLADFEAAASKGKAAAVSRAFAAELKVKTVQQIIDEVDKYYKENPDKLSTSVLEVILIRCTTVCPPGLGAGAKK